MKALSIRARTALLCGAMVGAVALLALAVNLMGERALVRRYYRHALEVAVELARDDVHFEHGKLDIDRKLDNPSQVRLSVYSEDEALLYGRAIVSAPFEDGVFRPQPGRDGANWYVYDVRVNIEEAATLWLRACVSSGTLTGLQDGQTLLLRLMIPVLAVLAGLCGLLIARRILKPVDAMTEMAASIADGHDLARRVPLSGPRDEMWRMGQVYNDMLARLEQSFERERRFSADAAHELRTPMAAIMSQADYALSNAVSDSERREALETIRRRAGDMNALIGTLMQLARMESGQATPSWESVALDELILFAVESMADSASEKNITMRAEAQPVTIRGDQWMLTQAVINLLDNAVRYGRTDGHVWIHLSSDGATARIAVSDDGPGMSAEQLARCFDRFWQADNARKQGSGLGLSLVERITRLHGGRATAATAPEGGCVFVLMLPVNDEKGDK